MHAKWKTVEKASVIAAHWLGTGKKGTDNCLLLGWLKLE
jgi:hypothetical protein